MYQDAYSSGINYSLMPPIRFGGTKIGRAALKVAIAEMNSGAGEVGGNNFGPWVKKYLNELAVEGSAWCAAFVSHCFSHGGFRFPFEYTVSAKQLLNQFRKLRWCYDKSSGITPEPGDIVFWWRIKPNSWQGHCGLVHHYANGRLFTIEGNRSSKVEGFSYGFDKMKRLLGFGRVPDDFAARI